MYDNFAFEKSIKDSSFPNNWLEKSKSVVEEELGLEVSTMVGFEQRNPHHCYTLFEHCLRTAASIDLVSNEDLLLRIAAFYHDLAKPAVVKQKENRFVFYKHAEKSAVMVEPLLRKLGYEGKSLAFIIFLIRHHDDFINYTDKPSDGKVEINEKNLLRYWHRLKKCYPEIDDNCWGLYIEKLFQLCRADAENQSEKIFVEGILVDSRALKLDRLDKVKSILMPMVYNNL